MSPNHSFAFNLNNRTIKTSTFAAGEVTIVPGGQDIPFLEENNHQFVLNAKPTLVLINDKNALIYDICNQVAEAAWNAGISHFVLVSKEQPTSGSPRSKQIPFVAPLIPRDELDDPASARPKRTKWKNGFFQAIEKLWTGLDQPLTGTANISIQLSISSADGERSLTPGELEVSEQQIRQQLAAAREQLMAQDGKRYFGGDKQDSASQAYTAMTLMGIDGNALECFAVISANGNPAELANTLDRLTTILGVPTTAVDNGLVMASLAPTPDRAAMNLQTQPKTEPAVA